MQTTAPSMKTIARLAGVSRMTVSRALRNDRLLRCDTIRRIHQIAEDLGYRPDPRVSELMSHLRKKHAYGRSETIARIRVIDCPARNNGADPRQARISQGVARAVDHAGYRLDDFVWRVDRCSAQRMADILGARGIRGVILLNDVKDFDLDDFSDHLACVVVGLPSWKNSLHRVSTNHHYTIGLAMEKLSQCGRRHIGLFLGSEVDSYTEQTWRCAFLTQQFEQNMLAPELACLVTQPDAAQFRRWFESVRPDAVMTNRHEVTDWLEAFAADVSDDVGLVQLDWSPDCGSCAGVDQRHAEVGAVAVDLVQRQLMQNQVGPPEYPIVALINGAWVGGESLRPAESVALSTQSA